jgi:hypothetical protein
MSQFKAKVRTYPYWVQTNTLNMLGIHPGWTVGGTHTVLAKIVPVANGETPGEFYLSNDLVPPRLYIWTGAEWYQVTIAVPAA